VRLNLGTARDPLIDAAAKARTYVNANPSRASELASLASLARSKNRPDVAAILSAGADVVQRPPVS
jgi:hypothetical protein